MQLSIHCKPLCCRTSQFCVQRKCNDELETASMGSTRIIAGCLQHFGNANRHRNGLKEHISLSIRNEVGEFWESWDRTTLTYAVGTLGIVTRTNLSAVVASHGIEGCVPELELHGNFSGSVTYSSSAKDTYISGVGSNYPDVLTIALIEKMRVPALAIVCSNREIVCRKTFNVTTANATWATIFQ